MSDCMPLTADRSLANRKQARYRAWNQFGFTIIELLVVVAIIGILLALLLPAVQNARAAAQRTQCQNHLKQFGIALTGYADVAKVYPWGRMGCDGVTNGVCTGNPDWTRNGLSGVVMLLPYLEQTELYKSYNFEGNLFALGSAGPIAVNTTAFASRPAIFVCPTDTSQPYVTQTSSTLTYQMATSNYAFCSGTFGPSRFINYEVKYENNGVFYYKSFHKPADVEDGLSHTIFMGEVILAHTQESSNLLPLASRHLDNLRTTDNPINTPPDQGVVLDLYGYKCNGAFASRHEAAAHFLFGDGHVGAISEDISLNIYRAISTRDYREDIKIEL